MDQFHLCVAEFSCTYYEREEESQGKRYSYDYCLAAPYCEEYYYGELRDLCYAEFECHYENYDYDREILDFNGYRYCFAEEYCKYYYPGH